MALSSYGELLTAIQRWAWRDDADFADRCADFVALAEASLSKKLRVREMRKTALLTPTTGIFAMPSNVVAIINLRTQNNPTAALEPVGQDYTDFAMGYRGGGLPIYYNVDGDGLRVFPLNDGPLQITYYEAIPALSEANPTNWLLEKAPELYLHASLVQAMPFTQEVERLSVFGPLMDDAIAGLISQDVATSYAGAQMRLQRITP